MGQSTSSEQKQSNSESIPNSFSSNAEVLEYFNKKALKLFTVPELIAFRSRLGDRVLTDILTNEEITQWLHIPSDNMILREVIYNFIHVLSNFPLVKEGFDNVTGLGLLKSIVLINRDRCRKFLSPRHNDQTKLVFVALSTSKTIKEDYESSLSNSRESTSDSDTLKNYDSIPLDELTVPAVYLREFLAWLLLLTACCTTKNCSFPTDSAYLEWPSYQHSAMNLLRSMDTNLTTIPESSLIDFVQFSNVVSTVMPDIFASLERIMEHLLYRETDLIVTDSLNYASASQLLNHALISQLATSLPKELMFSKLRKLYAGRESGFSMRSLQSKVFKWMAPTIILISGKCILNDEEYMAKNARYKKFLHEFPKLKNEYQHLNQAQLVKQKCIYAVYIADPWKVTNKGHFGGPGTKIIQLSPTHDIFRASQSDVVYFNTLGGGIGIGDDQPIIKGLTKSYAPGNVSLTLDNALEFAVFRHIGNGGRLLPGALVTKNHSQNDSFEIKLLIQDLEVWGCGGEKELQEQLKQWEWEENEAKRRQQINLRSIGEDRALLEMAGIIGAHSQSGGSM